MDERRISSKVLICPLLHVMSFLCLSISSITQVNNTHSFFSVSLDHSDCQYQRYRKH